MKVLFADTSWWVALLNPRDHWHQTAIDLGPSVETYGILTTDMVLIELLNHFSAFGPTLRRAAVLSVADINATVQVVPQTRHLFEEGLTLYGGRLDKGWSLTDCASMAVMIRRGISEILTADHHFEQAGFQALMRH
jgi:predicted nucleic acid-binding protein